MTVFVIAFAIVLPIIVLIVALIVVLIIVFSATKKRKNAIEMATEIREQVLEVKGLRDAGKITEEEFEVKKAEIEAKKQHF